MIRGRYGKNPIGLVIFTGLALFASGRVEAFGQSRPTPIAANSGQLTSALGALNAAHANSEALGNAAPQSEVGKIAAYDNAMLAALALPDATPAEAAYRDQQIAAARATYLAAAANKPLSPAVVAKVDSLLALPASNPDLGVSGGGPVFANAGRDVGNEVVRADPARPVIGRPEVGRPGFIRPNVPRPSIERPNISRPNIPR